MTPRLWVPLTQVWSLRNWNLASAGWERTASIVANRVETSTPLRGDEVSVTVMVVVPLWWVARPVLVVAWGGSSNRSGRAGRPKGQRSGREVQRLGLQGLTEPDLELDEALRRGERSDLPGEVERRAQGGVPLPPVA